MVTHVAPIIEVPTAAIVVIAVAVVATVLALLSECGCWQGTFRAPGTGRQRAILVDGSWGGRRTGL